LGQPDEAGPVTEAALQSMRCCNQTADNGPSGLLAGCPKKATMARSGWGKRDLFIH